MEILDITRQTVQLNWSVAGLCRGVTAEMYVKGLKLMTLTWQHSGGQSFAGSDFEGYGEVFFADRVFVSTNITRQYIPSLCMRDMSGKITYYPLTKCSCDDIM